MALLPLLFEHRFLTLSFNWKKQAIKLCEQCIALQQWLYITTKTAAHKPV